MRHTRTEKAAQKAGILKKTREITHPRTPHPYSTPTRNFFGVLGGEIEEQEKTQKQKQKQKKKKFVRFQTPIWTDKKTNRHSLDPRDHAEQPQNKPTGRTNQVRPVRGVRDREREQEKENGSACEQQQPEKGATLGRALRRPQTFSENKKKEKFLKENKTLKERKEEIEGSRPEDRSFFRDGFQNYVGDVRGEKGGPDLFKPKVQSL